MNNTHKDCLLIVDDTPENIDVLVGVLSSDYRTKVALNGDKALALCAGDDLPDLILLDIMMPKMDGYEVCRRLKEQEQTSQIPIIFVTAKGEEEDETKGLELGAVDYITKPISPAIVKARVATHLTVYRQHRKIEKAYSNLQELEMLRDNLMHMVIHDMRGPLAIMKGYLDILKMHPKDAGTTEKYMASVSDSCTGLVQMVNSLLDVSRLESNKMPLQLESADLNGVARFVAEKYQMVQSGPQVIFESADVDATATCDAAIVERIIANLTGNSVKFTPNKGSVTIRVEPSDNHIKISIIDTGKGIPSEHHEKIFEKFGQVGLRSDKCKYSTGLGLTFCKLATETHGGQIGVDSELGTGSTFWFTIPKTAG